MRICSAVLLQAGEFAVVQLALKDGLAASPDGDSSATWAAYVTYVVGYRHVPHTHDDARHHPADAPAACLDS
jgi:uncharacterized membrane protein